MSVVVHSSSKRLKCWSAIVLLAIYATSLLLAASGYMSAYSMDGQPRPKRFYMQVGILNSMSITKHYCS